MTKKHQTVIGIDPSLTGTAVALGQHPEQYHVERFTSRAPGAEYRNRMDRYEDLVARILDFVDGRQDVGYVLIEDYAFSRNDAGAKYVAEYRGILGFHLIEMFGPEIPIVEVPAGTLKKFVSGKGNVPKETMRLEAFKRWEVEFESNDEVDAFGLYRLGLCLAGRCEPDNQKQREAVQAVRLRVKQAEPVVSPF